MGALQKGHGVRRRGKSSMVACVSCRAAVCGRMLLEAEGGARGRDQVLEGDRMGCARWVRCAAWIGGRNQEAGGVPGQGGAQGRRSPGAFIYRSTCRLASSFPSRMPPQGPLRWIRAEAPAHTGNFRERGVRTLHAAKPRLKISVLAPSSLDRPQEKVVAGPSNRVPRRSCYRCA
jgi:hypothetical protein